MALCNKIGSLMKLTTSRNISLNCQVPMASMLNAIRNMSRRRVTPKKRTWVSRESREAYEQIVRERAKKMVEKRNKRDQHKHGKLLAAKSALKLKLYEVFCKDAKHTGLPHSVYQFCRAPPVIFRGAASRSSKQIDGQLLQ